MQLAALMLIGAPAGAQQDTAVPARPEDTEVWQPARPVVTPGLAPVDITPQSAHQLSQHLGARAALSERRAGRDDKQNSLSPEPNGSR